MFGIGIPELLFILALALIVLGPEKLPTVAKQLARFVGDLKRAADEFKEQIDLESLKDVGDLKPWEQEEENEDNSAKEEFSKKIEALEQTAKKLDIDQKDRIPGGVGPEWKIAKQEEKEANEEETLEKDEKEDPDNAPEEKPGDNPPT